jgi:3-phenylpropionate/trans-cinnamate dioxygenase ferredoxin subunit
MSEKLEIGKTDDFKDGVIKGALVNGKEIIAVRIGNGYYAAAGRCPHMKASLSAGKLEGTVITCPLHGSQFDLKDGAVVKWVGMSGIALKAAGVVRLSRPLKVYKVEVSGDSILVEV